MVKIDSNLENINYIARELSMPRYNITRYKCIILFKKYKINVSVSKFIRRYKPLRKKIFKSDPFSFLVYSKFEEKLLEILIELQRDWKINSIIL